MKKLAVVIYIIALILVGCGPVKTDADFRDVSVFDGASELSNFNGVILEVYEGSILVRPDEDSTEAKSANKIVVTTDLPSDRCPDKLKVGDEVRVYYNGGIMESYPAMLGEVAAVYHVDKNGNILAN